MGRAAFEDSGVGVPLSRGGEWALLLRVDVFRALSRGGKIRESDLMGRGS